MCNKIFFIIIVKNNEFLIFFEVYMEIKKVFRNVIIIFVCGLK